MARGLVWLAAALLVAGCNTTPMMDIPKPTSAEFIEITKPRHDQATLLLTHVVSDIRRGQPIAHFPAYLNTIDGVKGTLCNYAHEGKSTADWVGGGLRSIGDLFPDFRDVFFDTLSARGLSIAGDPSSLFTQEEEAAGADYRVAARIKEMRGNFCEAHDIWYAQPRGLYAGEAYVKVQWSIYSVFKREEVLKLETEGWGKHADPSVSGIEAAFIKAFASASENLLTSRPFVNLAMQEAPDPSDWQPTKSPVRSIAAKPLSKRKADKRISRIAAAVVVIRTGSGHGSGFLVSKDGLILTNRHVVGEADHVIVRFNNGLEIEGDVLARHNLRDVALVKTPMHAPNFLPLRTEFPKTLDPVIVIGAPTTPGMQSTVTRGVVSAFRSVQEINYIQSDVSISSGNSGGPLLDENGNVIGITVASWLPNQGGNNLNLFIPIAEALRALNLRLVPPES